MPHPAALFVVFLLSAFVSSKIGVNARAAHIPHHVSRRLRLVGGAEATPHSAPFMVAIIIDIPNNPEHYELCGGTLISHKYVITAGHCLQGRHIRHILLGATNRNITEPEQQKVQARKFVIHGEFGGNSDQGYRHDLAIIELETSVDFDHNIRAAAIPRRRDQRKSYVGEVARAYGWGVTQEETSAAPETLQYLDVSVIPLNECRKLNVKQTRFNHIYDEDICTSGAGKKGHCHGDSGGPLILNGTLIGVISRGLSDHCSLGEPSVYARISNHLNWIEAHTDLGL